jgi:4-alpha-glucanotransferase
MFNLGERASGILLHVTSLPNGHGIGDLGPGACEFVDFLNAAGCRWWQMLPLGPPAEGDSPYKALSAFAGNPLIISLDRLFDAGLLDRSDLVPARAFSGARANFMAVARFKQMRLRKAYQVFRTSADRHELGRLQEFRRDQQAWLDDYALFCALRAANSGRDWSSWRRPQRARELRELERATREHRDEIEFHQFVQYQFDRQWRAFKEYCVKRGVGLIGDVPIFVAHDSSDVWVHQTSFALDRAGRPALVAGSPPDYFSKTGQIWGNPHYQWDALKRGGYRWWLDRLQMSLERSDAVRLDHFIGFERYWAIPAGSRTAQAGRWMPGPGSDFFHAVRRELGETQLIAEDLGAVTPEVRALRDEFHFPGMHVLQFGFDGNSGSCEHQPHNFRRHAVAYTGTHDNDTTTGWFRGGGSNGRTETRDQLRMRRRRVFDYASALDNEIHWVLIRLVLASVSNTAIIPMQDLLGLGSRSRMNRPGSAHGNWQWRLLPGSLDARLAQRLRRLNDIYGRSPDR